MENVQFSLAPVSIGVRGGGRAMKFHMYLETQFFLPDVAETETVSSFFFFFFLRWGFKRSAILESSEK